MPMEKVFVNLHRYGNTSAASVAIALDEANREGRFKRGDNVAFAGFGARPYMGWPCLEMVLRRDTSR